MLGENSKNTAVRERERDEKKIPQNSLANGSQKVKPGRTENHYPKHI